MTNESIEVRVQTDGSIEVPVLACWRACMHTRRGVHAVCGRTACSHAMRVKLDQCVRRVRQ